MLEGKSFVEALQPKSTWADYASAAVCGALASTGIGLAASIAANAAIGGATYLTNCSIKGVSANPVDLGVATGIGAVAGIIGGRGVDGSKLNGVMSTAKEILKTAVSPKKVAMYTAKIAASVGTAVVGAVRTLASIASSNWLNNKRMEVTRSVA